MNHHVEPHRGYLPMLLLCLCFCVSVVSAGFAFSPDLSHLADRDRLEALQRDAFNYAIEHADPESGLIYETSLQTDPRPIAVGGSGFGAAAIVVAAERGWIERGAAVERLLRMTLFLRDKTERGRYHGAFPHWLDGKTGKAIPFGPKDEHADIVETSLLMQGLLIARSYFDRAGPEAELRSVITELWEDVDWNHYTNGEENGLYWHWDPERGFHHGMKVQGYNECLITYVLAMASPTHPISRKAYEYWHGGDGYSIRDVYGYRLEAAPEGGGPLFLAQYSFIGIDPRRIADAKVRDGYFVRSVKQALSNRAYCLYYAPDENGYGLDFWGLTAGSTGKGYRASAPGEDHGVMTPTAALASLPFTPGQSLAVLRRLRDGMGETVWGDCGPYDGVSQRDGWISDEYLAINQLPIVGMAENYRSGLLWNLFMSDADVRAGLERAGLRPPDFDSGFPEAVVSVVKKDGRYVIGAHEAERHPDSGLYRIPFWTENDGQVRFSFLDEAGREVFSKNMEAEEGRNEFAFAPFSPANGKMLLVMKIDGREHSLPVRLL